MQSRPLSFRGWVWNARDDCLQTQESKEKLLLFQLKIMSVQSLALLEESVIKTEENSVNIAVLCLIGDS